MFKVTATFQKSVSEIRHFSESVGNWKFNLLNSVEVTFFNFRNIICAKVPVWSPAGFSPLFWSCDFEPGCLFIDVHGGLFVEQVLLNLRLGLLKHPDLLRRLPQRVFQSLLDTLDGGGLELEVLGNVVITKVHSLSRYLHTLIHFTSNFTNGNLPLANPITCLCCLWAIHFSTMSSGSEVAERACSALMCWLSAASMDSFKSPSFASSSDFQNAMSPTRCLNLCHE